MILQGRQGPKSAEQHRVKTPKLGEISISVHGPLYTVVHALYTVVHALLKTNASSKLKGPVESDDEHKQLFHPTITTGIAPMVVLIYMNVAIFAGESN